MKNKKATYILLAVVILIWGLIIYRIVDAAKGGDDILPIPARLVKEPYNDFTEHPDTAKLMLNYRDPFGKTKYRDTLTIPVKRLLHVPIKVRMPNASINWSFIKYSGYIRNPGSRKIVSLLTINDQNQAMIEGETKGAVKLLKNMRDSIKIQYKGEIKYIPMKHSAI